MQSLMMYHRPAGILGSTMQFLVFYDFYPEVLYNCTISFCALITLYLYLPLLALLVNYLLLFIYFIMIPLGSKNANASFGNS